MNLTILALLGNWVFVILEGTITFLTEAAFNFLCSLVNGRRFKFMYGVCYVAFCFYTVNLDHRFKQKSTSSMAQVQNSQSDKNSSVNVFSIFLKAL